MKRRNFLSSLTMMATSTLLSFKPAAAGGPSAKLSYRRVRPTDAAWPEAASWEELNRLSAAI
jgi:L,D-peptidoglycan transpeptidase YkuD (ErfK/YbiS/YcfS/YnhG family)